MKSLSLIAVCLAFLGATCVLPQRTATFIPPTNERDLCKTDARFRYAPTYDFCWRYPSAQWSDIVDSGPRETGIPSVTGNVFSLGLNENRQNIFTLFVGPNNLGTRAAYAKDGISVVSQSDRYLIGYQIEAGAAQAFPDFAAEVPDMLKGIYFFTPDGLLLSE